MSSIVLTQWQCGITFGVCATCKVQVAEKHTTAAGTAEWRCGACGQVIEERGEDG